MSIELTGIVVKHERRLRLVFSNTLAGGAFGTPSPAYYVVENQDGKAPSPLVNAAIIVAGSVTNVELALDHDLIEGALYRVTAIGVPAVDASTSTSASDELVRFGTSKSTPNTEPKVSDADLLFYGRDAIWTGKDYLEAANGDLAEMGGIGNAQAALRRRLLGGALAWAPGYSPKSRQYVDIPIQSIGGLRGQLEQQALRDDRVKSVDVRLVLDDDVPDESLFVVTPTFIGGRASVPIDVAVPVI